MDLIEYIDTVEGKSRFGKSPESLSPVTFQSVSIVSELYTMPFYFETIQGLYNFLEKNPEISNSMYYIKLEGIPVDIEELRKITKPIFIPSLNSNDYKLEIFDLPNIVVGASTIDFEKYLKTIGRQMDTPTTFTLSRLTPEIIEELVAHSKESIYIRLTIKDFNTLTYLREFINRVPFNEKAIIIIDNNFFQNEENRQAIFDKELREDLSKIPTYKYEVEYKNSQTKSIIDILDAQELVEFIINKIPSDASELDKVTFVTEFLARYMSYDMFNYKIDKIIGTLRIRVNKSDRSFNSMLSDATGVCRHYAALAQYIFEEIGVTSEVFTRQDNVDPNKDGHAFNMVTIDGREYYLDITWISNQIANGEINNCVESKFFMSSKKEFGHNQYLEDYDEEGYDIDQIEAYKSLQRVIEWASSYKIKKTGLLDLINKKKRIKNNMLEAMRGIGGI